MSSMAITLHHPGHCAGDVRGKKIVRDKRGNKEKRWLTKNKGNTKSWGNLQNTFKFWWRSFGKQHSEGGSAPSQKTDTRNSNTHRLQLKQASPELRAEDFQRKDAL